MYQVDAFVVKEKPFSGNPAAVLILDDFLEEALLQRKEIAINSLLCGKFFMLFTEQKLPKKITSPRLPTLSVMQTRPSTTTRSDGSHQAVKWIYAVMPRWHLLSFYSMWMKKKYFNYLKKIIIIIILIIENEIDGT